MRGAEPTATNSRTHPAQTRHDAQSRANRDELQGPTRPKLTTMRKAEPTATNSRTHLAGRRLGAEHGGYYAGRKPGWTDDAGLARGLGERSERLIS